MDDHTLRPSMLMFKSLNNLNIIGRGIYNNQNTVKKTEKKKQKNTHTKKQQQQKKKNAGYRDTTNATGYNERNWKWWRHNNIFGKKKIYFSHIPYLLGWLFCIAAGKRYCLLQIQLQRNLFTTNENKSIFSFVKPVFTNPSILRSTFSDRYASFVQMFLWFMYCGESRASIYAFLWVPGSVNVHWIRKWFKAWFFIRVQLTTGYDTP